MIDRNSPAGRQAFNRFLFRTVVGTRPAPPAPPATPPGGGVLHTPAHKQRAQP